MMDPWNFTEQGDHPDFPTFLEGESFQEESSASGY